MVGEVHDAEVHRQRVEQHHVAEAALPAEREDRDERGVRGVQARHSGIGVRQHQTLDPGLAGRDRCGGGLRVADLGERRQEPGLRRGPRRCGRVEQEDHGADQRGADERGGTAVVVLAPIEPDDEEQRRRDDEVRAVEEPEHLVVPGDVPCPEPALQDDAAVAAEEDELVELEMRHEVRIRVDQMREAA